MPSTGQRRLKGLLFSSFFVVITLVLSQAGYARPLFLLGPSGGYGGAEFQDDELPSGQVAGVVVCAGVYIDAVQMLYKQGKNLVYLSQHGGSGGTCQTFTLRNGEHIIEINGRYGALVDSLTIITDKGNSQTFGGNGGPVSYVYSAPTGREIAGFFGQTDFSIVTTGTIEAIGVILR